MQFRRGTKEQASQRKAVVLDRSNLTILHRHLAPMTGFFGTWMRQGDSRRGVRTVAMPVQLRDSTPGPKYSMMNPVPP
jgi:hypothetical protein